MPRRALLYIAAITALGASLLGGALASRGVAFDAFFAASLLLGAAVSAHKIKLPGMEATISGGFAFLLLAIGSFSWEQTVVLAAVSALVQSTWRTRQTPLQVAFNSANLVVCASVAHWFAHVAATGSVPAQITLAAVLLYILNTLLVSIVICLVERAPLSKVWETSRFWAFPYYLAGGLVSAAIIGGAADTQAWISLAIAPAVILIASYYRQYVSRAQAAV